VINFANIGEMKNLLQYTLFLYFIYLKKYPPSKILIFKDDHVSLILSSVLFIRDVNKQYVSCLLRNDYTVKLNCLSKTRCCHAVPNFTKILGAHSHIKEVQ